MDKEKPMPDKHSFPAVLCVFMGSSRWLTGVDAVLNSLLLFVIELNFPI